MAAVRAVSTYTDASPANDETLVIGGKTYTWKTSLTNTDGFVALGADATAALANMKAAINLEAGAGTAYAAATVINAHVKATGSTATTLTIEAKVPGSVGNFITTTETAGSGSWTSTVMAGGTGVVETDVDDLLAKCQVNSDVLSRLLPLSSQRA